MSSVEPSVVTAEPEVATAPRPRTARREGAPDRIPLDDRLGRPQPTARCSPDPFVATDRYRLTMPYADRI